MYPRNFQQDISRRFPVLLYPQIRMVVPTGAATLTPTTPLPLTVLSIPCYDRFSVFGSLVSLSTNITLVMCILRLTIDDAAHLEVPDGIQSMGLGTLERGAAFAGMGSWYTVDYA